MKAFETLETIKVGTYIYNTASTGKENVIVVDAIEEKGGKKYAVGTRNGSPARFEIKVNEYFNYEYFVPMNKRGKVQNEVNIVWEHHRVKDEAEAEIEEPKSGDVVEIDGKEYEVTAVENYGFFVKGRDYIIPFSDEYKIVGDAITEWTSRPKSGWTYLYTDDKNYNIDMDVYRTEDGKLVKVDGDWIFGF